MKKEIELKAVEAYRKRRQKKLLRKQAKLKRALIRVVCSLLGCLLGLVAAWAIMK